MNNRNLIPNILFWLKKLNNAEYLETNFISIQNPNFFLRIKYGNRIRFFNTLRFFQNDRILLKQENICFY